MQENCGILKVLHPFFMFVWDHKENKSGRYEKKNHYIYERTIRHISDEYLDTYFKSSFNFSLFINKDKETQYHL